MHDDLTSTEENLGRRFAELKAENAQLRRALMLGEDRLRAILASATDYAIVTTDLDGRVTGWNAGARNVLGWDEAEVLGEPLALIYTPEDREAGVPAREIGRALVEGSANDERWHVRRDGARFWGQGRVMPLRSVEAPGFLKILRDGTEQRRTADALREAAERFQLLADNISQFAWMAEPNGSITWYNRRWHDYTGTSPEQTLGWGWQSVHHPDHVGAATERFRAAVAAGEPWEDTFPLRGRDGEYRWFLSRALPIRDEHGRVTRWFGTNTDVTDQREVEVELERRVAERTAELAESQARLAQSQKMEAVGRLTGGIAHDFNNLLTAVLGGLELIVRRPGDRDRVARLAKAAREAALRGAKLTGQLLAFSRKQRLIVGPVDVNALLAAMEGLLAQSVTPHAVVRLDLGAEAGLALADANQLELAVLNLAINARDAMPEGGTVRIRTALVTWSGAPGDELAPGDYVEVAVEDTGVGMDDVVRARAFEPFFTTKPADRGTGLGLAQVYGIAQQAGGAARIESAPGRGTIVRLLLPRLAAAGDTSGPDEDSGAVAPSAAPAEPSPVATVLVVDDDADVRRLLAETLEALGYRAELAESGEAGLRLLDATRPDLLLVDFTMPGMSGAEVAQAARERHPGLPVVFATGYADTAVLEAARRNAPVLRKPFAVAELETVLARLLAAA